MGNRTQKEWSSLDGWTAEREKQAHIHTHAHKMCSPAWEAILAHVHTPTNAGKRTNKNTQIMKQ